MIDSLRSTKSVIDNVANLQHATNSVQEDCCYKQIAYSSVGVGTSHCNSFQSMYRNRSSGIALGFQQ